MSSKYHERFESSRLGQQAHLLKGNCKAAAPRLEAKAPVDVGFIAFPNFPTALPGSADMDV